MKCRKNIREVVACVCEDDVATWVLDSIDKLSANGCYLDISSFGVSTLPVEYLACNGFIPIDVVVVEYCRNHTISICNYSLLLTHRIFRQSCKVEIMPKAYANGVRFVTLEACVGLCCMLATYTQEVQGQQQSDENDLKAESHMCTRTR